MNNVKVFPLRLSEEFHKLITESAKKEGKSLHQYIIESLNQSANQTKTKTKNQKGE